MRCFGWGIRITTAIVLLVACASDAALPPVSEIVSVEDLEGLIQSNWSEIEQAMTSPDSFRAAKGRIRLLAGQLAVFSQSLAEHNGNSPLKTSAPKIRDAAIEMAAVTSFDAARAAQDRLTVAMSREDDNRSSVEVEWTKLARLRLLMEILRDQSDQVRKALRRSKDPVTESRQATAMALVGLAVATHTPQDASSKDAGIWHEWSLEFQREMTLTATALRRQDRPLALEHFTAAQAVCTKCHDNFKP